MRKYKRQRFHSLFHNVKHVFQLSYLFIANIQMLYNDGNYFLMFPHVAHKKYTISRLLSNFNLRYHDGIWKYIVK